MTTVSRIQVESRFHDPLYRSPRSSWRSSVSRTQARQLIGFIARRLRPQRRTISRGSCCLLLAALSFQSNAQVATNTVVHSDSFATYCTDPTRSSCLAIGPSGSEFTGFAGASAAVGSLGAEAHFTANDLFQLAGEENYSRAQASWTDRYLVPADVAHVDFIFHVTGQYSILGDLFSASADITTTGGMDDFNGANDVFVVANVIDAGVGGRDYVIGVDRIGDPPDDVFASNMTHQLDVLVGITTWETDQLLSGVVVADFSHTVQLVGLDLFGANGRITDVATVAGTSGHLYNVLGFVSSVPEPPSYALLLLGLAILPLIRVAWLPCRQGASAAESSGRPRGRI